MLEAIEKTFMVRIIILIENNNSIKIKLYDKYL